MKGSFLKIAITLPGFVKNESERIRALLESGEVNIVHIRKPDWDITAIEKLICDIPDKFHDRLKLHDHFSLIQKHNLRGAHLNSRNVEAPVNSGKLSKSLHSISELETTNFSDFEYVTLSPVFDSISKEGYKSGFDLNKLKPYLIGRRVVALGGVTAEKFHLLEEAGFIGGAMIGGISWER